MKNNIIAIMTITLLFSAFYAYASVTGTGSASSTASIPRMHPEKVAGQPDCRECHTDNWKLLNHKAAGFFDKHRFYAQNERMVCASCHEESFCSDCHTRKGDIKPSSKFSGSPERNLPHRGDYLSQHKIDGRIYPASCVKCHGRQNNERCNTCHR